MRRFVAAWITILFVGLVYAQAQVRRSPVQGWRRFAHHGERLGQTLTSGIPTRGLEAFYAFGLDGGLNSGAKWYDRGENLLLWSEDLTNAVWTKTNVTATDANSLNVTNASHLILQQATVVPTVNYTFSWKVKLGTLTAVKYALYDVTNAGWINSGTDYTSEVNGSSFTRVSKSFTAPAGCVSVYVYMLRDSGASGTVDMQEMQLTPGTSAGTYRTTEARQRGWDWSGNARHFERGSGATTDAQDPSDGIFDNSGPMIVAAMGDFDGTDDYNTVTLALTSDWTFSLVLRADDNTSRGLFRNGATTPNISLDASGKVSYVGGGTVGATNAVAQTEWHMIAITKVGTTITHYLDGAANGSGTSGSGNAFANLRIGYDGTAYYDGMAAWLSAYSRGLTPAENLDLYKTVRAWWNLVRRGKRNLDLP